MTRNSHTHPVATPEDSSPNRAEWVPHKPPPRCKWRDLQLMERVEPSLTAWEYSLLRILPFAISDTPWGRNFILLAF